MRCLALAVTVLLTCSIRADFADAQMPGMTDEDPKLRELRLKREATIKDKAFPKLAAKWPTNGIYVCWENPTPKDDVHRKMVEARILDLSVEGSDVRWFVDPASGRILRSSSRTMGPAGPAEQAMDYSDWRMVDGVAFAYKRTIKRDGEDAGAIELTEHHGGDR